MNKGIKTVLYPVKDINQSKTVFRKLLGVEPYADQPYYVGFKIGDQDIGLVPNNPEGGVAAFFHVDSLHLILCVVFSDTYCYTSKKLFNKDSFVDHHITQVACTYSLESDCTSFRDWPRLLLKGAVNAKNWI